jgi:EAL domain-containing protein (putative c-di-GMP-specific phosphodiesterase class I)
VTLIARELERLKVPGKRLISEITENVALLEVTDTAYIIKRPCNLGIGVALDDPCTGFSSLAYFAQRN